MGQNGKGVWAMLGLASVIAAGPATMRAQDAGGPPAGQVPGQHAEQAPGHRGQYAGMGRVAGEVTAVNGATVTVRSTEGGTVEIVTTDNTRVMKDRGPVKLTDLHPGDGLMAFGNLDTSTNTLHAAMVMAEDAAQVKAMRENLGKTYITGRVTAVDLDNARMTVERPDHVAQTIGFDETTSFKRAVHHEHTGEGERGGEGEGGGPMMGAGAQGVAQRAWENGEGITLADIKVGDFVSGTGTVKSGVFVPVHLLERPAGPHRSHGAGGAGTAPGGADAGQGGR